MSPVKRQDGPEDLGVLFVRRVPRDVLAKLKAVAALNRQGMGEYVLALLTAHLAELEKKGVLPKGK